MLRHDCVIIPYFTWVELLRNTNKNRKGWRFTRALKKHCRSITVFHTNQTPLSSNRLELSPWSFTHVFKKIETTMRWNCMSKALRFLQITARHQDFPFFTVFLIIKTSFQNISTVLEKKSSCERFCKVPRAENHCWSKIGNGVISLLWQLRCHCNPDDDKLSSWSQFFQMFVYGDVSSHLHMPGRPMLL